MCWCMPINTCDIEAEKMKPSFLRNDNDPNLQTKMKTSCFNLLCRTLEELKGSVFLFCTVASGYMWVLNSGNIACASEKPKVSFDLLSLFRAPHMASSYCFVSRFVFTALSLHDICYWREESKPRYFVVRNLKFCKLWE